MTPGQPRFLQLQEVADILNTSTAQVYALVRRQELPAIKIGGRGQWRVEASKLEEFIEQMYTRTDEFLRAHPWSEAPAEAASEEDLSADPRGAR